MSASKATRERKEDFKKIILDFVKEHKGCNIRIMDLASGPAREIKELLGSSYNAYFLKVFFDWLLTDFLVFEKPIRKKRRSI